MYFWLPSLSLLKDEGFYGKCKDDCKQEAEAKHHKNRNTKEIMFVAKYVFDKYFYRHGIDSI